MESGFGFDWQPVHLTTKRRKRTTGGAVTTCDTSVDIEDLHESQCRLVCAPILPSQSVEEWPLSITYDRFADDENAGTARRHSSGAHFHSGTHQSRADDLLSFPFHLTNPKDVLQDNEETAHYNSNSSSIVHTNAYLPTLDPLTSRSECLLDRVNPEYFAQEKYKWHSSMEQEQDTLEMTSIDPESAQDFTALYMKNQSFPMETMIFPPLQDNNQAWMLPDLDGASTPSKSSFSSPDSLMMSVPTFDQGGFDDSLFQQDVLEDVNQMFDWDEACASLVTDHEPAPTSISRLFNYDTSLLPGNSKVLDSQCYSAPLASPGTSAPTLIDSWTQSPHPPDGRLITSPTAEEEDGPCIVCHNCGVTKTPLWRRTPDKRHSLCNACGLYLKQYKIMRPLVPRSRSQTTKKEEEHVVCHNCEATKTSLWRKDEAGQVICNACGLYFKLHGTPRPVAMRKEKISRRKRYRNLTAEPSGSPSGDVLPAPLVVADLPQAALVAAV